MTACGWACSRRGRCCRARTTGCFSVPYMTIVCGVMIVAQRGSDRRKRVLAGLRACRRDCGDCRPADGARLRSRQKPRRRARPCGSSPEQRDMARLRGGACDECAVRRPVLSNRRARTCAVSWIRRNSACNCRRYCHENTKTRNLNRIISCFRGFVAIRAECRSRMRSG